MSKALQEAQRAMRAAEEDSTEEMAEYHHKKAIALALLSIAESLTVLAANSQAAEERTQIEIERAELKAAHDWQGG